MGCWNNPYNPGTPFKAVVAAINADPAPILVIGGDNIYPLKDKVTKNKVYDIAALKDGISLIHKEQVYAALGNHNVEVPAITTYEIDSGLVRAPNYIKEFDDFRLVVIDTNNIDGAAAWLAPLLETAAAKPYFLVQHEPYISIRKQKESDEPRVDVLPGYEKLLSILVKAPPKAILCADTHNFQHGIVSFAGHEGIHQYTVGTGGAILDPLPPVIQREPYEKTADLSYQIVETAPGYGYLRVDAAGVCRFVPVATTSGGRRRTRVRRSSGSTGRLSSYRRSRVSKSRSSIYRRRR